MLQCFQLSEGGLESTMRWLHNVFLIHYDSGDLDDKDDNAEKDDLVTSSDDDNE